MRMLSIIALIACAASVASAEDDPGGTLNPEELTLNSAIAKAAQGETSMMVCAMGYPVTKQGVIKDNHHDGTC